MDPKKFDPLPKLSVEYLLRDLPLPTPAVLQQALRYEALPTLSTGKECLHLRGLPDDAQPETIIEFLGREARSVIDKGVHIIYNAEGRPSGEAIIQMKSEESAFWAVAHSHDRYMMGPSQKPSRIEALLCSVKEMKAKLASSVLGPFPPSLARDPQQELYDAINTCRSPVLPRQPSAMAAASPSSAPPTFVPPGMPWPPPNPTASAEACSLNVVTMLLVRNLPDSATVRDIMAFFKGCLGLEPGGVYMMHLADRRFKDSAFVAVPCDAAAVRAFLDRQCHYIGNRKVDLSIVDTGSVLRWLGAPSRAHLYNVAAPLPYAGK